MELDHLPVPLDSWNGYNEEVLHLRFPMHLACRDGDAERLSTLLNSAQFSIYEEDVLYGWTPAHWAAYYGKLRTLMLLISPNDGIHVDIRTKHRQHAPSHFAASRGHGHCLKWLLHCGANLNVQDYLGETPLHKAARAGSMECISLLTAQGASLRACNMKGQTGGDVAKVCGHAACGQYLDQADKLETLAREQHPVIGHVGLNGVCNGLVEAAPTHMDVMDTGDSQAGDDRLASTNENKMLADTVAASRKRGQDMEWHLELKRIRTESDVPLSNPQAQALPDFGTTYQNHNLPTKEPAEIFHGSSLPSAVHAGVSDTTSSFEHRQSVCLQGYYDYVLHDLMCWR